MANDTTHNGWTNYETWLVVSWLTNDEHELEILEEVAHGSNHLWEKAEMLKDMVLDNNPMDDQHRVGMYRDLLYASIERVNWREIIEAQ